MEVKKEGHNRRRRIRQTLGEPVESLDDELGWDALFNVTRKHLEDK